MQSRDVINYGVILFHRVLDRFSDAAISRTQARVGRPLIYPDGSLFFDCRTDKATADRLWFADLGVRRLREERVVVDTSFRHPAPLFELSHQRYHLFYGEEYKRRIGEAGFLAGAGGLKIFPGEYVLDNMQVSIRFKRNLNDAIQSAFVTHIRQWLDGVAGNGLWGEGRVKANTNEIEFWDKRANIVLDISKTGANTLNWLILCLLEFGHRTHTITSVNFDLDDPEAIRISLDRIRADALARGIPLDQSESEWLNFHRGGAEPRTVRF